MKPSEVLDFWFGPLDVHGMSSPASSARWWKKDAAFDREIKDRFAKTYNAIVAGERRDWARTSEGRLASIIVLDQFSRNMFRDVPKMYAADAQAQQLVTEGINQRLDDELVGEARSFFYMPLMHAENIDLQDQSVGLFGALREEHRGAARERFKGNLEYAVDHRAVIARFGRFPHRNAVLERRSTRAESAYLKDHPGW